MIAEEASETSERQRAEQSESGENRHYFLIKNMSRLVSKQLSKLNGAKEICFKCMNGFPTKEARKIHEEYCRSNEFIKMPKQRSFIKFKNHNRSEKVPFVVYADFECLVESISESEAPSACQPSEGKGFTHHYFRDATKCWICNKSFDEKKMKRK